MILFDLDGTLVDTTDLILQSFAHAFDSHLPGRLPSRESLVATFGRSLPETLDEIAAAEGVTDARAFGEAMLATYRDFQRLHHDVLIRPFPGVAEMLDGLARGGHDLGLVTSKMEGFARRGLRMFDLERHFQTAVFHDDTERHKPDPEPLLLAAERAGRSPGEVIYVGDSTHDIVAGRAAGMKTVAVLWGPFSRHVLEAERPDWIIERPGQLLPLASHRSP